MFVDKLTTLKDLLIADAGDPNGMQFDIQYVATWAGDDDGPTAFFDTTIPSRSCGTKGCAIGLASMSGAFPELAMHEFAGSYVWYNGEQIPYLDAAIQLFGISFRTACWLFSPGSYGGTVSGGRGELLVAARIDEVINKGDVDGEFHR